MRFNTITGEVYADFYNGGFGEMEMWDMEPTAILVWGSGRPYGDLWIGLWEAIKFERNETYNFQNMELQNWDVIYLDMHLSGYNPFKYKLTVYILVGTGWWIKPQWKRSFLVGFDKQYKIWTQTGGFDNTATVVAAMILPIDSDIDINNYYAAKAVALNYVELSPTAIPTIQQEITVYVSGNTLYLNSPASETVSIYSVNGNLLYTAVKSAGEKQIPIGGIRDNICIVKGSSGWVRKIYKAF